MPRLTQPPRYVPRYGQFVAKARTDTAQFRIVFLEVVQALDPSLRVWYPVVQRVKASGRRVTVEDWGLVQSSQGEGGGYADQRIALVDALMHIRDRLARERPPDRVLTGGAGAPLPIQRVVHTSPYRTLIDGLRQDGSPGSLAIRH